MDSFETFMDIFQRNITERNSSNVKDILADGRRYFQNISKNDSELMLSMLFDKNKGLLIFLDKELKKSVPQKGFDVAIKEGFNLLEFVMEQFVDIFEEYLINAKDTCELALKTRCSMSIKKAACSAFNKLIQLYKRYELELGETVKRLIGLFSLIDIKERSLVFSVLGTISKHNPEVSEIRENSHMIFQQLRNDFKKQYKPDAESQPAEIQMYLDVLSDMLNELSDEVKEKYSTEIYEWIKDLSPPQKYRTKKVIMKSAIDLLSHHICHFREFVYRDYKFWYNLFINLTQEKNKSHSECGQRALKSFYRMIGTILKSKNSDADKAVFLYFKDLFENELKVRHNINSNMLRFIIYGFSQLAAPCKRYLSDNDVKNMFSLIAHCGMSLYSREDLEQTHLESICYYEEALSEIILHIQDISVDQINVITKLSILLIKRFPNLSMTGQTFAISSLIKTIINIGITNNTLFEECLHNLFHDGIIWTCSHTLLIDAEYQRGLQNLSERPLCYKNYLPLWSELLNYKRYKQHTQIAAKVVDSMMQMCIILIAKLNLKTKLKEDSVFSDASLSQTAENEGDFKIFINIVDLYVDILKGLESFQLTNTLYKFLLATISTSYKHPLISGFYKLVHVSFKHICYFSKDQIGTEVLELLYKYLLSTLDKITTFSNELLTTCLYLILNIPITYVEQILDHTIPVFKIAFNIGLSDFELARTALNALENWTNHLNNGCTSQFLREILPLLEPYLQTKESSAELLQDIIKTERKVIKHITLIDDENTLERFQIRILLFIASLDTDIITDFVYKRSTDTGATWDKKDLLQYSLPFSDTKVKIYFDKILPRLIVLAQSSGDRPTKVIACEVLHSIIAYILGESSRYLTSNRYNSVYKLLWPALLNLGSNSDEIIWKIFQPLMLQLMHWFSSKFMLQFSAPKCLLDSLFQGLSDDSNSALREFSGMCLAEFTRWSIKQSDYEAHSHSNIDIIIQKITNFSLHSSISKRVAAAIAFNHLYTILREDEKIVSIYWLQIFYCFVRSLDGCNDSSIHNALSHVERVLIAKKNLLNAKHVGRKKPHDFNDATLKGAVNWLLIQCSSLDQNCRSKCMELFVKISQHVDQCDSAKTMIDNYINANGIEDFNHVILKDTKSKIESLSSGNLLPLLKTLEFYIWLIRNNLVSSEILFENTNSKKEIIFNCTRNFIHVVNRIKMEDDKDDVIILSKNYEDLETLKCKVTLTTFNFLQMLLDTNENFIPSFFLSSELFEVISKCIIYPQLVGFDAKNIEITKTLPSIMENLLCTLIAKLDDSLLNLLKNQLIIYVEKHINDFLYLDDIVSRTTCREIKQYVQGLIVLDRCNILHQLYKEKRILKQPENVIQHIFNLLAKEQIGVLACVNIKPPVMDYLQSLMQLLLIRYEPSITKLLIELISNDTVLEQDSTKIAHGIYFLSMFKDEIFGYILKDIEKIEEILDAVLERNLGILFNVTEDLLLYVQRNKKELQDLTEDISNIIIKKFTSFERAVNKMEDRKKKLISIYGIAVHLKHKAIEVSSISKEFYTWILQQLTRTENSSMEYRICILQNFLVCLTDMTSDNKPELIEILHRLRTDGLSRCPNGLKEQNIDVLKVINCFRILVTLLPVTKSVIVFESIILFAAGVSEHFCNEKTNEYLENYFKCISNEYQLKSLEVAYKLYMDSNKTMSERFDILYKFLLSAFEFCKTIEIEHFFERNIKEIYTIIRQGLVGSNSDIKQLIISKIGCFELIGLMFAKINISNIDSTESIITRNAVNEVNTGRELLQHLYSSALNVRTLKSTDLEHKEIMRLLHCAAYNCSIAIVCLKRDEDSYLSMFAENKKKEQLIWENIIDCDKRYDLKQTVEEYPKNRKKLVNIRKSIKDKAATSRYSYIHTFDLSTSTLNEDINAYDFNEMVVRNKSNEKEESMSIIFESDDLNNHECMASICAALKHIMSEEISVPSTEDDEMPKWLKCFCTSLKLTNYNNVRLFMLKIVWNMETVLKCYAKFLLQPIIYAVYVYLKDNQLNYIVTDVLMMLIDWHSISIPNEKNGAGITQKLWEVLIHRIMVRKTSEISRAIYKYNFDMMKTILEVWHTCLKLPANLTEKMISAPEAAIYLILISFVNGMEKDIIQNDDILTFLEKFLEKWQNDEDTILRTCECIGLILKYLDDDEALTNKKCAIIDNVRSTLRQMQSKFENRQMKCIRAICKNYPKASMIYFEFVTGNMSRVDAVGKANCLEIFLLCIPNLDADRIIKELGYIKFHSVLQNKILTCENVSLRIIDSLTSILPPSNLLPLINLAAPYAKHNFSEYRNCVYNIFINVYKKYSVESLESEDVKELMRVSKEILLTGLLDPAEDIQEKLLKFWSQDAKLASKCKERLLEVLNTYMPNVGYSFLPFVLLTLLDLTNKSVDYTQKMFEPLHNCKYEDYKIAYSWRTKNLGSMAPLFAPSLTSQMNQTFSQMNATLSNTSFNSSFFHSSQNAELLLRETQEPEFESTFIDDELTATFDNSEIVHSEFDGEFKLPEVPQLLHNKKPKRFLTKSSKISMIIQEREIKKNIRRTEMIKEEVNRQRNSVKLYRKYRIGDFPDIEISHSNLIEPLLQLAKKDQLICKDLTVSIICSILEEERSDSFIGKVSDALKYIIEHHQENNVVVAAVLEILLSTRLTDSSPEVIAKVSKSNNLNFLGSLILEENLILNTNDMEPFAKKARFENVADPSNKWLPLADLYESMNDVDVVLSIFQNHIQDEDLQAAAFAQSRNNWMKAKVAYERTYRRETEAAQEHCFQSLLKCLGNLCFWSEIGDNISDKLNGNMDNIWNDSWKNSLFPWLFELYVRKICSDDVSESFENDVRIVESWMNNENKAYYIKRFFGEELAMFFVDDNPEAARNVLMQTLDEMKGQWIKLHPLSAQLKIRKLQKLRMANDIYLYLKVSKTASSSCDLQDILKFWCSSVPSAQDDILPWDKLMAYRMYFTTLFKKKLTKWQESVGLNDSESMHDTEENDVSHRLHTVSSNMQLKMFEAALHQKNKFIAEKYFQNLQSSRENGPTNLENQCLLANVQIKYLKGEVALDMKKKLSHYASSWDHSHRLIRKNDVDSLTAIRVRQHISKVALELVRLNEENETFADLLTTNSVILKEINAENRNSDEIRNSLETYSLTQLKMCCDTTINVKECYFTLSKYCYGRLFSSRRNDYLSKEFVNSTLKAMSYGSLEAAHYFPCLLKPEYFEDEETKEIFLKESKTIQPWLFLSWQAQLFSHLTTSIAPLVIPILERLVETYPNAVIYTFRLTVETNHVLLNDTKTYKIRQILSSRPEVEKFLKAMQYVVQPELYLRHHLIETIKKLSLGTATAIDELLKIVYRNAREDRDAPKPGNIYSFIAKYENTIKGLERKKPAEIKQALLQLAEKVKISLCKRQDKLKLKDYSPWLYEFSGGELEIPGQYSGRRKPMPQYHAKIMKIEPIVTVMQSLRKPIRLTMVGNDAKEYNFLVKFGEDLRLDQRLQQLFTIMNKTLQSDAACKQRQLSIDTYQVIPLSRTLGLIQWIPDTKSLQDLINFTLTEQQIKQCNTIQKDYNKWIESAAPSKKQYEQYKEATLKYNASRVIAKMNEFINKTEMDSLRKTLTVLCPSPESFVCLRRNFVSSYATMCIAHWILGIGDRHLENILITIGSGRCLGIDFGLAFGAGIDQKVPELIPFRVTPQILGLLKPFTEKDFLSGIMIHTLRALRNEQGPILACMDVFVHEPLDWTEHVNKTLKESDDDITDVKWMPKKKINVVTKKLNGIKPSMITLEQLRDQHDDKYFDRYYSIVTGDDDMKRIRATIENDHLSSEKQVECLLDQATDLNILGRLFAGWKPWL